MCDRRIPFLGPMSNTLIFKINRLILEERMDQYDTDVEVLVVQIFG